MASAHSSEFNRKPKLTLTPAPAPAETGNTDSSQPASNKVLGRLDPDKLFNLTNNASYTITPQAYESFNDYKKHRLIAFESKNHWISHLVDPHLTNDAEGHKRRHLMAVQHVRKHHGIQVPEQIESVPTTVLQRGPAARTQTAEPLTKGELHEPLKLVLKKAQKKAEEVRPPPPDGRKLEQVLLGAFSCVYKPASVSSQGPTDKERCRYTWIAFCDDERRVYHRELVCLDAKHDHGLDDAAYRAMEEWCRDNLEVGPPRNEEPMFDLDKSWIGKVWPFN